MLISQNFEGSFENEAVLSRVSLMNKRKQNCLPPLIARRNKINNVDQLSSSAGHSLENEMCIRTSRRVGELHLLRYRRLKRCKQYHSLRSDAVWPPLDYYVSVQYSTKTHTVLTIHKIISY